MASVAKYAILVLAATMSLEQLGIAETIVVTAFSILVGSLGLAAAIAIGLGSKDVVKEWADAKTKSRSD
jgi:small-conductance mechanosensitive channel